MHYTLNPLKFVLYVNANVAAGTGVVHENVKVSGAVLAAISSFAFAAKPLQLKHPATALLVTAYETKPILHVYPVFNTVPGVNVVLHVTILVS